MPARGRRGGGPRSPVAPIPCPECGGPMWDNSLTKTNPKAPDYQCKDAECVDPESGYRTGVWARDSEKNAAAAGAQGVPKVGTPAARPLILDKALEMCLTSAGEAITKALGKLGENADQNDYSERAAYQVQVGIALFQARTHGQPGILKAERDILAQALAKRQAAERQRQEEEAARARAADDQAWDQRRGGPEDEDLPF